MVNYFSNDLEIVLTMIVVSIIVVFLYDLIRNRGKFYVTILRPKISIQNKNTWSEEGNKINEDTKGIDFDFKLQLYNHKKNYSSIYNITVEKRKKLKRERIDNPYLNLVDKMKTISGASSYEKLKYATLLPFEIREFSIKIKLTKTEAEQIKKEPIFIVYKVGRHKKQIKLNHYLRKRKK